jgi:hypothetical protein
MLKKDDGATFEMRMLKNERQIRWKRSLRETKIQHTVFTGKNSRN